MSKRLEEIKDAIDSSAIYPNNVTKLCRHSAVKFMLFSNKHNKCYWTSEDEDGNTPEDWEECCWTNPAELVFNMTSIGSNPYVVCTICKERESLYCSDCDRP